MNRWIVLPLLCFAAPVALADSAKPSSPFDSPRPVKKPPGAAAGYSGLGADSLAPEEIAKFAAPALDAQVSRRMQAMLDVRGAGSGAITANGQRMYYTSSVTGSPQVWRQDGPMKFPLQLTGGEDRTGVIGLAPDDSFVAVSRDVGGQENPGLYLMNPDGGALRLVQHTPKVQTSLQFISDDAKTLYFKANDIQAASYAIYRFDVKTGTKELVFDAPGLWSIADHRGDTWLLLKELGNTQTEVYQYELASKKLTPLLGQGESEEYDVAFGARAGQVLVRTNKLGDFQRVYSLEAGTLTPISPDIKHDVESFTIDETRTRIYFRINADGYQQLQVVDAKTLKPSTLPKLPDAENVLLSGVSRNGRYVQLSVDGATLPSTSVTYDWKTKKTATWRLPMTPEIDTKQFAKATLEFYPARDGTKIPMFVRRPSSTSMAVPRGSRWRDSRPARSCSSTPGSSTSSRTFGARPAMERPGCTRTMGRSG
jgi:hypothetical protein